MNRITISIGILFMLVLLVYMPGWINDDPQQTTTNDEESWRPNYQASNMRSTLYDDKGEINHQVFALKMEHYQLLGFTIFSQPKYTIYVSNQQNPWHVEAREGTLYEDNRIQLETEKQRKLHCFEIAGTSVDLQYANFPLFFPYCVRDRRCQEELLILSAPATFNATERFWWLPYVLC